MHLDEKIIEALKKVVKFKSHNKIIPLHEPTFKSTNASKYVLECINAGMVSSIGKWGNIFENKICEYTSAKNAILVTNGTVALRLALYLVGVRREDEVLIPSISFVATANAISHLGAFPHFIDVSSQSLGMDPTSLEKRLHEVSIIRHGKLFNKFTDRQIKAILPVHIFGNPADMFKLKDIAEHWGIPIVEDSAEALGSWHKNNNSFVHCGLKGDIGILSFNGNKIITTGGGGALITNNDYLASKARHLSTTAKVPHPWEFDHDEIGWNDRMPSLNAALGVSQIENLEHKLKQKKKLYEKYELYFKDIEEIKLLSADEESISNNWLISIEFLSKDNSYVKEITEKLLKKTNDMGIYLRPLWRPLSKLKMYKNEQKGELKNSDYYEKRIICLPSSPQIMN